MKDIFYIIKKKNIIKIKKNNIKNKNRHCDNKIRNKLCF